MSAQSPQRKLTTILAADVVGYSRLMAADEEATFQRLKTYRAIIDELIEKHQGRLVNTAGDAVIVEFGSAVEAVRCAISIQEELAVRNAELPDDRRMLFRIGINVGDVMIDGDNLFGDGVNVAARLEGLAEPGSICVSGSTFEQVKNKVSISFEDTGQQEVKNIPYPVSTFRIVPGPVSVVAANTARDAATAASGGMRWRRGAVATGVVLAVALGGAAVWRFYPRGLESLADFPRNISTDDMRADRIEAFMAGMTFKGVSPRTGQPFTISVRPDKTADVAIERGGAAAGTTFRETGKWWVQNYHYCMQFAHFAHGRRLCPRIVKTGHALKATHPDGRPIPWKVER